MTTKENKFIANLLNMGFRLNTAETIKEVAVITEEASNTYKEFIKDYKKELCK